MSIHATRCLPAFSLAFVFSVGCASSGIQMERPESPNDTSTPAPPSSRVVAELPKPWTDAEPRAGEASNDEPTPVAVPIPGSELIRGRSTVLVAASMEKTREAVLDFGHYADFMPHYRSAKLLGRTDTGAREVYMEVEALYGAVKFWTQIEMPKPTVAFGVETWESRFIKGNVKDFKAIWRLKKIDEGKTELSLEVFLNPNLPMPTKLMNNENLKGSASGVAAMRRHAEEMARAK